MIVLVAVFMLLLLLGADLFYSMAAASIVYLIATHYGAMPIPLNAISPIRAGNRPPTEVSDSSIRSATNAARKTGTQKMAAWTLSALR